LGVTVDSSGVSHFPGLDENAPFAIHAMTELQNSSDGLLLRNVGNLLKVMPGNADDQTRRFYQPRAEFGDQLIAKAQQLGGMPGGRIVGGPGAGALIPTIREGPPMNAARESMLQSAGITGKPLELAEPTAVISKVDPKYPALARQAGIAGDVRLIVMIAPDGRVAGVDIVGGPPLLLSAAVDAMKQWVFAPAYQNGAPVPARFGVVVPFRLEGGAAVPTSVQSLANTLPPPRPMANGQTPPPMPQKIRVGANVQAASLIKKVAAVYPSQALTAGPNGTPLEGTVRLQILIGKDGHVMSTSTIQGHPMFAAAAQEAVLQYAYKPTLLNGNPVEVSTTVDVDFSAK
jgi:TonB family protein